MNMSLLSDLVTLINAPGSYSRDGNCLIKKTNRFNSFLGVNWFWEGGWN